MQLLQVDPVEFFDSFEVEAYQRIMQSYTADFGDMVGPPFIVTIYNVTDQELATTGEAGKLILDFTIRFESKYGYDVEDYPSLFLDYINNNLEEVTVRMQSGFLENVVEAKKVQLFQEESSSISPSPEGGISSLFPSSNVGAVSLPPSKATLLPKPSPWPSISDYPTISSKPSPLPSISDIPSAYPSTVPSFSPSTTIPLAIQKNGMQLLEVNLDELFDSFEIEAYQRIMQSYTEYFGEMIGPPFIFTTCYVTDQEIATNGTTKKLVVDFTIGFESKYGYDVDDYPSLFQDYMNNNLEEVTARMQSGFLDNVVAARRVQLFRAQNPTNSPEEIVPSLSPSSIFVTSSPLPSEPPSVLDEGGDPSLSPSRTPATYSPSTDLDNGGIVSSRAKWTIGLLLGVTGSALVVLFIFYKMSRRNRLKDSSTSLANSNEHYGRHPDEHNAPEFTDVSIETVVQEATTKKVNNDNKSNTPIEQGSDRNDQNFRSIPSDNMENGYTSNYDTEYVNAAAIHESKLESSKSVETRDKAVESMRTSIVESVRGSDPMMSLAMVAALMDDVEEGNDMLWGESLDAESIEAECLWEVHSWIRKNDRLSSDER